MLMYEFLYGYVKPKYGKKAKLCHIDADTYMVSHVSIKIDDKKIYKDFAEDVEIRQGTSNYELDHCLYEKIKK